MSVVGYSTSGKTAVASALIELLTDRGYRVGAVKHCPHGHQIDHPDSDTDRLYRAGATSVIASSPGVQSTISRVDRDGALDWIVSSFGPEVDLVVAEGFKCSGAPKVVVLSEDGSAPAVENVIATVAGVHSANGRRENDGKRSAAEVVEKVHDLIAGNNSPASSVSLVVNGTPVPLKEFPSTALAGTVEGFVSSLNGVPTEAEEIQITVRRNRVSNSN